MRQLWRGSKPAGQHDLDIPWSPFESTAANLTAVGSDRVSHVVSKHTREHRGKDQEYPGQKVSVVVKGPFGLRPKSWAFLLLSCLSRSTSLNSPKTVSLYNLATASYLVRSLQSVNNASAL